MSKILFLVSLSLIQLGCARVNQESRDYYQHEKKIRHGVIPLDSKSPVKPIQEKIDQSSIARGQVLYQKNCQSCHGADGQGQEVGQLKAANLKNLAKEVTHFKFFMSISQWQGDMPGWKSPFSETEREDLANYIKSFASQNNN